MSIMETERASSTTLEIKVLPRHNAWLAEVQDAGGGRRVPLALARVVVGSGAGADLRVDDATVSARHCVLTVMPEEIAIEDLGSKNGTYVGGARVREARGGAGTTIVIGRTSIELCGRRRRDDEDDLGAPLDGVAGASSAMRRVATLVRRFAKHSLPVLVTGESGTGKELVARALHTEGARAQGPFVAINVAALPRELVESELFGHERGAFTGAVTRRLGAFSEAEGGTLFLDEIGDLPLDAQPKLLRALDGYDVRKVGAHSGGRRSNARIVAATNATLDEKVDGGEFRLDLFHRLNVFVVRIPPLRDRRGDLGPIARTILEDAPRELGARGLTSCALARLVAHDWPGNVRELRGVLYRACDETREGPIDGSAIDRAIRGEGDASSLELTCDQARVLFEEHGGNASAAARAAGMPRSSFRKLLKR